VESRREKKLHAGTAEKNTQTSSRRAQILYKDDRLLEEEGTSKGKRRGEETAERSVRLRKGVPTFELAMVSSEENSCSPCVKGAPIDFKKEGGKMEGKPDIHSTGLVRKIV